MGIKSFLRKIRLLIGHTLLDKNMPETDMNDINSILFIRHDGKLGDFAVTGFIYRELKKFNPGIRIGVVATESTRYIYEENPYIDKIYIVKKYSVASFRALGKNAAKDGYDVVVDLTEVLRNRDIILIRAVNAGINIGSGQKLKIFNINIASDIHINTAYARILDLMGFCEYDTSYYIPFDERSGENVETYLAENHIKDFTLLNCFGAARIKKISEDNILLLIDNIAKRSNGRDLIILSYPAVRDCLERVKNSTEHKVFIYNCPEKIFEAIEIIRKAAYIITPDTSVVHFASGMNKPITAFYLDHGLEKWLPKTKAHCQIIYYSKNINTIDFKNIELDL